MKKPRHPAHVIPELPVPGDKLLKRSEAAKLLGMSVSTLRRREGDLIRPVVDANGVHRFAESELRAVMVTIRHRETVARLGSDAGDIAADVFTLLDEGAHPAEIVKQLREAPETIMALHEQWARMRGGFVVLEDDARSLALTVRARKRAESGREFVEQVEDRFVR
ncbi:MAG TPA: hypothetical protein VHC69_08875 [Polyangiaceae bacterium]|nr:hypothetical protein [Polyangiaceae bacterium]